MRNLINNFKINIFLNTIGIHLKILDDIVEVLRMSINIANRQGPTHIVWTFNELLTKSIPNDP